MKRPLRILLVFLLILGCTVAVVLVRRPRAGALTAKSLIGVWEEVRGGETLVFSRAGDLRIDGAAGQYCVIDASHLQLQVPSGSPRLVFYSSTTGELFWTNGGGVALRYEYKPSNSLLDRARRALGL